jgi:hypothetical protein
LRRRSAAAALPLAAGIPSLPRSREFGAAGFTIYSPDRV